MKFYVNRVRLEASHGLGAERDYNHIYVGLFDSNEWEGRESFCGWYGEEVYKNVNLLAFYRCAGNGRVGSLMFTQVSDVTVCHKHLDEIATGGKFQECVLEAENIEEAIRKFRLCMFS